MTTAGPARWPEIRALLLSSGLPTRDLSPSSTGRFLVETEGDALLGCVAVEPYGDPSAGSGQRAGLLRSLAVAPEARGRGLGGRLVDAAEARARADGLGALYLLTATAEAFFRARGWRVVDRAEVPSSVRASSEFRGSCCASAVCLWKALGSG